MADIRLRLLDLTVDNDTYAWVLHTLGRGIKTAAARIEKAEQEGREDYAEAVIDQETEIIESLLGTAYVLCQTQITAVTQATLNAREQAITDGLEFVAFGNKPHELRALGDRFDASYSRIEVLWALANYFKHRDEWHRATWGKPTGRAKCTVPVLKAAGLQPSSTGNLRTGAEALGNREFADMTVFETIIRTWAREVQTLTKQVFGR